MPGTTQDLWKKGEEAARNPSRWDRIKHSGFVRRNKKPDAMLKNAVSGALEAMPVPVVASVINAVVDKAVGWAKSKRNQQKVKSYGSGANLEKKVKHNIKKLDLEELDRARAKVRDAVIELNKQLSLSDYADSPCDHIFKLSKGMHYLEKRVELLETRAKVFKEVGEDTMKWAAEIRSKLDDKKPKSEAKMTKIEAASKKYPFMHDDCEKSLCIR